ncbi:efflux RND transporter periplasmic adaptor subunit [Agrobacterium sp. El2ro-1b]|uniref:efflux RND transporter periplasmic adaptor subunit n=1 Tax=Agrobacterium sp. El2ro-1b TaxID=2969528 RepID=UPI003AABFCC6
MHPSTANMPRKEGSQGEDVTRQRTGEPGDEKTVSQTPLTSIAPIGDRPPEAPKPESVVRPPSAPRRPGRTVALLAVGLLAVTAILLSIRYLVPKPAELMSVGPDFFQAEIKGPGTLDAINKAKVSSSLQGVITTLYVDRNDVLRKGDIIAEISADDLRAQLGVARASQEATRKAVEASQADSRRAEATLANARSTLARQEELQTTGVSSRSALESAQTAVQQGEADLSKAGSSIRQAEAQEAEAAATVEMNQAQLDKSVIKAPIDGIVVARDLNLGDVVSPGTAIVELVDPSSIVLTARFDESAIASLSQGQDVKITFNSQGELPIDGKVLRIGREVDTETREFTVDITPQRLPSNWAIGQRGIAVIALEGRSDVISVPASAIVRNDGHPGVWTAAGGRASWRPVALGSIGGNLVEVRSGLNKGDVVMTDPKRVYAFMPVAQSESRP